MINLHERYVAELRFQRDLWRRYWLCCGAQSDAHSGASDLGLTLSMSLLWDAHFRPPKGYLANSADSAASDQGLHCLQIV